MSDGGLVITLSSSIQSLRTRQENDNESEHIKLTGRSGGESGGGASKEGNGTNRFHGGAGAALCCARATTEYSGILTRT